MHFKAILSSKRASAPSNLLLASVVIKGAPATRLCRFGSGHAISRVRARMSLAALGPGMPLYHLPP